MIATVVIVGYALCIGAITLFAFLVLSEWIGFRGKHSRSELHSKWRYRK